MGLGNGHRFSRIITVHDKYHVSITQNNTPASNTRQTHFPAYFIPSLITSSTQHRTTHIPPIMFVRLATLSDLDAMSWVLEGASPLDPIYPYRFPDRHLYPHEFAALCRQKCREYLATSTVVVCETSAANADPAYRGSRSSKVVAFSAWDTPIWDLQPVGGMFHVSFFS